MMKSASKGCFGFLVVCCIIEISRSAPYVGYNWFGNSNWQELPTCNRLQINSPCDKAVKVYRTSSLDSEAIFTTETPICACPSGSTCPSEYSDGGPQSLSYRDSAKKISISLHYCQEVYEPNSRTCVGDEVAVVMEGGIIPIKYRTINCRCPQNAPMRTKRTYMENTWMFVKELVCEMPVCTVDDSNSIPRCKKITRTRDPVTRIVTFPSTNICDCPRNYECVRETTNGQTTETFGNCMPIRIN